MEQSKALGAFSALANETRLDVIRMLIGAGRDGNAACDIAERLGISASRLSFHLATLEQAGLITSRRVSRHIFYAADTGGIGRVISYLLNDCCKADPEVSACCGSPQAIAVGSTDPEP